MELEEASSSSVKDPRPSLGSRLNPVYQYLIGDAIENFVEQLPTEMDVVKLFCFEWDDHKSANEKMTRVVNSIKTTWSRAGLPQRSITSIRTKVKNLIATFKSIVSSRTKGTASQGKKENDFLNKSKRLFDIIDQKSESKLNAIKKAFLSDQRDDRRLTFFDLNLNEDDGMIVGDGGSGTSNELMSLVPEDDDDDTEMCSEQEYKSDSESNYYPTSSDDEDYQPKKKLKTETINAMHDAGLSFRQMHKVSEAFIKQFDENPNDYCIATSTFHSKSTKLRKNTYEEISEQMKERNSKLVILFDTKTCDQLNAVHLQKQKRLAVVLYNERCHYGVCICNVCNSQAETLANKLLDVAIEYCLSTRIIGLSCDTENTNIGHHAGTCVLFERKIQKEILRLCCRHHILELVLKKVCVELLGTVQTPSFSFEGLEQLKNEWDNIHKDRYQPIDEEEIGYSATLSVLRDQAINQLREDTKNPVIRDDYGELNDICLKLLGVTTSKKIRVIGASSKARWMAKAILVGKAYLFRDQLDLDPDTCDSLKRICLFVCLIYVKYWNRATSVVNAPVNDLTLMQQLELYEQFDGDIARVAMASYSEHLWYLGGELITLSLFSNNVSVATKNRMRNKIQTNVADRDASSLKYEIDETTRFSTLDLDDFIQMRSSFLFQLLEINADFLTQDAATWEYVTSYRIIKNVIEQSIIVVNDGAERMLGVAHKTIRTQRARKEIYFKNLVFTKFDKNIREHTHN